MFLNWYKLASNDLLYHVTLTDHVPSIQENGIIPQGAPSNWIQEGSKERYGIGDVHAMQSLKDAVKWAANWDWQLSSSHGSGKVSIIEFKSDNTPWDNDDSDPLSQSGLNAPWIKRMVLVPPENILNVIPLTHNLILEHLSYN